jgi:hypothetical protein
MSGSPPASDQVQPGTHIVQVSANGFRSTRREVIVAAGQVQAIAVDLEAAAATGGTVRVVPPRIQGVQVYLDGEMLDGTPPERGGVSPGRHSVRISAPGRETVTREIDVTAGQSSVVEITEAQMPAARGRIVVRSGTPGARVFVDGAEVGAAPYEADASLGEHAIVVRAEGHAEQARTCTVAPASPCELAFTLEARRAPGVLRVAALSARGGRPVPNATVRINDGAPHPIGDIADVPAGEVRVVVEAPNYGAVTQTVVLEPGATQQLNVSLTRTGLSGTDVARRRAGLSTFGAAPLVRGDAAFDGILSYGGMPLEVRATMGFMPFGQLGPFVVDGGIAIRSRLNWWEFELRSRQGLRLFNDTFAFGLEERFGVSARGAARMRALNVGLGQRGEVAVAQGAAGPRRATRATPLLGREPRESAREHLPERVGQRGSCPQGAQPRRATPAGRARRASPAGRAREPHLRVEPRESYLGGERGEEVTEGPVRSVFGEFCVLHDGLPARVVGEL